MHSLSIACEPLDIDPEALADRILTDAALVEGITPEELLAKMARRANSNPRFHCLQPHDLQQLDELPEERREHVSKCSFCQVLLEGATPCEAQAAAFGKQTVAGIRRPRTACSTSILLFLARLLRLPVRLLSFVRVLLPARARPKPHEEPGLDERIESAAQIIQ
jgi:hypothetical protein